MASQGFSANPKRSAKAIRDKKIRERQENLKKTKELLESLNRVNRGIKGGTLSGRNLVSQKNLKERLERRIQDIDKKSAGVLATAPSSPIVKAVNQAERIATSNRAFAGLSERDKAKARIVTGTNNADTLSRNPDVSPETGNQRTARMGQSTTGNRKIQSRSEPKPAKNPDTYNKLKASKDKGYFPAPKQAEVPRVVSRATPVTTLSKKDVDEYSEAFASPDADKMYKLSEKSRRSDMNMLERALEDIAKAGDRATADRRKRGISDYADDNDIYGSRKGGSVKKTVKNKKNRRAALRGFGVETRGS